MGSIHTNDPPVFATDSDRTSGGDNNVTTGDTTPGTPIVPSDPGTADLQIRVDSTQNRRAISRYIYGINGYSGSPPNLTLGRSGGNRMTAYNWENNASNAGSDYFHQNDSFLGGGNTAGEVPRQAVEQARNLSAGMVITVPMQGYVAADKNGDGDVANTANYLQVRFRQSEATKGAAFVYPPDLNDGFVYQDEFVHWLQSEFPDAQTHSTSPIFYCTDNEPDLWKDTHPRIQTTPPTYLDFVNNTIATAAAIKTQAPAALVFGAVLSGWYGFTNFGNPSVPEGDFLDYYLSELQTDDAVRGQRLVDVLDLHWYPEARGGGVRVTRDDATSAVAAARVQAPRSLWDPGYSEDSWVSVDTGLGPIRLIPRVQEKIDSHYPGTQIAFTEYYYGGGGDISGAIAQADVLGIFGRHGIFAATLWYLGATDQSFIHGGFRMFRSYDGTTGSFGDTSVAATITNTVDGSAYGSVDASSDARMVIVAINKSTAPRTAGIAVTHTRLFHVAEVYRLTSASALPIRQPDLTISLTNAFQVTLPPMSVSTLVLKP